ncbi:MAG: hypothetical protein LW823_05520 [Rickettsiales bacterium]|jgi:hypothetical protein|nr:hypothetical protein [Rickettsiales bacterium]
MGELEGLPTRDWLKALNDPYWLGGNQRALAALDQLDKALEQLYAANEGHTRLMREWSETHDGMPETLNHADTQSVRRQIAALQNMSSSASKASVAINALKDIITPQTWRASLLSAGLDAETIDGFISEMTQAYQRDKGGFDNLDDYLHAHAKATRIGSEGWITKSQDTEDVQKVSVMLGDAADDLLGFLQSTKAVEKKAKTLTTPELLKSNAMAVAIDHIDHEVAQLQSQAQDRIGRVTKRWPDLRQQEGHGGAGLGSS